MILVTFELVRSTGYSTSRQMLSSRTVAALWNTCTSPSAASAKARDASFHLGNASVVQSFAILLTGINCAFRCFPATML